MCVGSTDNQTAEWISMKFCKHDPWLPIMVIHKKKKKKKSKNATPGGERRYNISYLKRHVSVVKAQVTQTEISASNLD